MHPSQVAIMIPVLAIIGGVLIAIIAIISATIRRVSQTRQIEESRREIAAYVAEGSISAPDAERLLAIAPSARDIPQAAAVASRDGCSRRPHAAHA